MEYLTKHFTVAEWERSQTAARLGILNKMNKAEVERARLVCRHILEPVRVITGPISISSGFRSKALNAKVPGSSNTSQHTLAEAADFATNKLTVTELFDLIRQMQLPFDQMIHEFNAWVHVSYGAKHRRQLLIIKTGTGYLSYRKDIIWTPALRELTLAFQRANKIDPVGVIGPITREVIQKIARANWSVPTAV